MSYAPPSTSKYAPSTPFSRPPKKPATDAEGWTTIAASTKNTAPKKWGESALKKAAPTFDELFPSLGPDSSKKNGIAPPTESLAEKMKRKMAEEQTDDARKKTEEEDRKKMQSEKDNENAYAYGVISQIGRFRSSTAVLRQFEDNVPHAETEEYYEDEMDRDGYGRAAGGAGYDYEENANDHYDDNDTNVYGDDGNEYDRY